MKPLPRLRAAANRLAWSALGAAVCSLGAASVDAAWARDAFAPGAGTGALSLYLADGGLLAPFAVGAGLAAGALALVVDPQAVPGPKRLAAVLRRQAAGRPADVAAFVPLAVLGSFLWTTVAAHLARAVLAVDVPPALSGVAIAAGSLGLGLLASLAVLAVTPTLRHALATASEGRPAFVDPAVTGAAAALVCVALFALGVATGTVSGEGGLFGIYGIFKRPELDLRAPGLLLAIALGGFFGPAVVARVRPSIALALAVLPLVLTVRAAEGLNASPAMAQTLERSAPAGRVALAVLRRLTDRDHDGYSPWFGGGDCNDHDPRVTPEDGCASGFGPSPLAAASGTPSAPSNPSNPSSPSSSTFPFTPSAPAVAPSVAAAVAAGVPADLDLVLITVDTLRADLGYAGNPRPVSPHLDVLAAESTVFERAYSLASYTGKSVGPMLIGKYSSETHRNWGHFNKFGVEDTFVAQRLQAAGIHTMSVQGHRYFGKWGGIERGFDVLDLSAAPPEGAPWDADGTTTSAKLTDAALALLGKSEHTGKRFFLWLHYLDPHADYLPHDDVPKFGTGQRDLYDGEVAFTDKHIGRLLDAIRAAPWGAKTAVVVTSDHGEAFGEHKMFRHGFELWEELVRVPLLVHVPGQRPSRVAARRSAVDLVPTLLALMRVPAPAPAADAGAGDGGAGASGDFLSGVSLLPDVFLAAPGDAEPRDVLVDMPAGPYNDARRAFIHGDLKLTISNGAHYELYDLGKDPDERRNLWSGTPPGPEAEAIRPAYAAMKARLREIKVTGDRK